MAAPRQSSEIEASQVSRRDWKTIFVALVAQQADQIVAEFGGDGEPARLCQLADEVEASIEAEDKARMLALLIARELRRRAKTALN
jgi:hypothetical protein